ncbi:DUF1987 domain-containing protein [Dendrosporobacter sp. 1207_IL3150]|uniref:DUF1987 domain-containing protein n=1 Tax=Dendrosporobacter sp. 1207_IL3150 TaxID=3084054 RepID=UPI002FDA38D3
MNKLYIEQTKGTPEVNLDPERNILELNGQSYPENAYKFYEPIFAWIDEYFAQTDAEVLVKLNLPYINTSSSKCIMMLLDKLDEAYSDGKRIRIDWYYDEENESELECAEEFQEDVSLPFEIIPIK